MLDLFKALADPVRLRLIALLGQGEFTVRELTEILGMGQSRISRHLKILLDARILTVKRQGTWSYYRLSGEPVLFEQMRPLLESHWSRLPGIGHDLEGLGRVLEERRMRSRQFFDRHARQWDDLARRLMPTPEYLPELKALIAGPDPVLEVGIGTGKLLAELATTGRRIIGIDHSPAMLEEARSYLDLHGTMNLDLRLGEMGHLPLSDGEAGCVILNMVLHHAPDPAAVLGETARVLDEGGCLVLADLIKHKDEWARERLADQWLGFELRDLKQWLSQAGLTDDRLVSLPGDSGRYGVFLLRAWKGESPPNPT